MRGLSCLLLAASLMAGCRLNSIERCDAQDITGAGPHRCLLPGWDDRPFDLELPADTSAPVPLLIAFHGGGGNAEAAINITCPEGDREHPDCLDQLALARGYAVVAPNGTGARPTRNSRTWNGGGGNEGYYCSAGPACNSGVDDMAFVDDLLAELGRIAPIDSQRIYVTGLSNGASMSYRVACERPALVRAAAPVSGPSQHSESGGSCAGGTPILHIHGTEDPCAPWDDATSIACSVIALDGLKVGVPRTIEAWRVRNGCAETSTEEAIPDLDSSDGSSAAHIRYQDCDADVELIKIEGGGHTWSGGDQYLSADTIGRLNQDFLASEQILDFFDAHP